MKNYPLEVPAPKHFSYVVKNVPEVTVEQRERALKSTHYNEFAFPAGMLTVDMLSDSGTTAMTDQQWSALFLGDESYGRNKGYYVLLDTFRDIFERGGEKNWKKVIDLVKTDCQDIEKMMDEMYLCEYEGGFFNGGAAQMERPNAFIIQQGRAAESVLMEIVRNILQERTPGKVYTIPSNGHFDTTEGNIKQMGSIPRNLYNKELLFEVPEGGRYEKNPFKGNKESFSIAKDAIENIYKSSMEAGESDKAHCGNDMHWKQMRSGIYDFEQMTGYICSNELEKVSGEKWREVMFVLEVIEHNDCRGKDAASLRRGLTLLVGMFRNRFPGQQWNPYEYRWTTVGDPGERGISPMLMAIAEL